MTRTRTRTRAWALALAALFAVVLVAVLVVIFRHERSGPAPVGSEPAPSSPGATVTATPGTPPPALSPLTGRMVAAGSPVLAVKIDNVAPARPQTGLGRAGVVYVEPVEGGLSRILAIFSGALPARIGPVRSARQSDLELLREYGRPGLAFSGANASVLKAVKAAPVDDLSQDSVPSAYLRSPSRPAPHNLFVDPRALLAHGSGISPAKDVGFRFGPLPPGQGTATARTTVRYGAASTAFSWSPARKLWNVALDGRPARTTDGGPLGAATVVLQYTAITASGLHDVLGNTTPYTHTVGSGKAVVLRNGVAITGRWSRSSAASGTAFTTTAGAVIPFAAGQVWVVYVKS